MSKLIINESTLTSIGNAIREKENSSDPIPVKEMAKRILTLSDISGNDSNSFVEYVQGTKQVVTVEELKGITVIRDYAFHMSSLQSITLPDTVTTIGRNAFSNTQLERFVIPDSVTYGNVYICQGCKNLREFIIGKGLTRTGNGWIDGCTALEYVEIPDNITQTAWYFFQ